MSKMKEAGTCTTCYAVSQEWFDHKVCPECTNAKALHQNGSHDRFCRSHSCELSEQIREGRG